MKATDSVYKLEREELERFSNQIRAENCNILYTTLQAKVNFSSHEKFLSSYYAYVVKFGFQMLVEVKEYTSKIILIKLADSLYTRHQKKQRKEVEETSHNLSDRQLAGLQYLSGYVIHKLYKKSKNCKAWSSPENQIKQHILKTCREEDQNKQTNQKLLSTVNRGGLWYVCEEIQKILVISEKYFVRKMADGPNPNIKVKKLITDITKFSYVADFFSCIVNKIEIDTDTPEFKMAEKSVLFQIVQLYIRVRMFSLAKDYVQQQRVSKSIKSKEKSLRKSLKKKNEEKV